MSDVATILAEATSRADARTAASRPIDYDGVRPIAAQQKRRLTIAIKKGRDAVVRECKRTVAEWDEAPFNGHWPDNWALWQRALDDVLGWNSDVRLEDL